MSSDLTSDRPSERTSSASAVACNPSHQLDIEQPSCKVKKPNTSPSETTHQESVVQLDKVKVRSEQQTSMQEDEPCMICLEVPEQRGVLSSCDHVSCFNCILRWADQTNKCPVCKRRFSYITREVKSEAPEKPSTKRKHQDTPCRRHYVRHKEINSSSRVRIQHTTGLFYRDDQHPPLVNPNAIRALGTPVYVNGSFVDTFDTTGPLRRVRRRGNSGYSTSPPAGYADEIDWYNEPHPSAYPVSIPIMPSMVDDPDEMSMANILRYREQQQRLEAREQEEQQRQQQQQPRRFPFNAHVRASHPVLPSMSTHTRRGSPGPRRPISDSLFRQFFPSLAASTSPLR